MKADKATKTLSRARCAALYQSSVNEISELLCDRAARGWMNYMFVTAAIGIIVFASGHPLIDHVTANLRHVSDVGIGWLSR